MDEKDSSKRGGERPASDAKLRAVIDASPVPIALNNEEGTVLYLSSSFTRTYGYDIDDVPTLSAWWPQAYPDPTYRAWVSAEWNQRIDRAMRQGLPFEPIEVVIRCKDGTRRTVIANASSTSGAFEATHLVTLYDITERKRAEAALEESQRRLRKALQISGMGYLDWDLGTNQLTWSEETYRLFGYEPGGFQPTIESTRAMVPPEELTLVEQRLRDAIAGVSEYCVDHSVIRADGRVIHVHAQSEIIRDAEGKPVRVLATVADITDRKNAEAALRATNVQLADADNRKSEFLAVLSHELRNPLTAIRNSAFVLERPQASAQQRARSQAIIARQVSHLGRLVDDLLDVTRITERKIRLQRKRVDLGDLLLRTIEDHRFVLEARAISVDLPDERLWVECDPTRMTQIFENLFTNAAKFTPSEGRVDVALRRDGDVAVVEVADTGVGIDAETLDKVFEPFAQADRSLDRSRGGLGLGLALVKGMVELHGGQVTAHSDGPGRGARFTVRVPLDGRAVEAVPAQGQVTSERIARRILLIEDNADAAESLRDALALTGHEVTVASDGPSGVAEARAKAPEVVLCDIGLPGGMDGYDVARALREDPATEGLFLVALTGYGKPADREKAASAGFDAHVAKPPDMAALQKLLGP